MPALARLCLDDNSHVASENSEKSHQSLKGKSAEATTQESRDLRLIDPEQLSRLCLNKLPLGDEIANPSCKLGLGKARLRVDQPQIGKNIAATLLDLTFTLSRDSYSFR